MQTLTTPLVKQMEAFAKWLTIFILLITSLLLIYGYFVGHHDFSELFMAVVGLAVAAIPEGLPAILTITLAVGVQAMARRNAIVRRLPAIETLGTVSVICTDKTGTLTRNEMMVASVLTSQNRFSLEGNGYAPTGTLRLEDVEISPAKHQVLEELARAAALCNDAALHRKEGTWHVEGDPMEGALLAFAGKWPSTHVHNKRNGGVPMPFLSMLDTDSWPHSITTTSNTPSYSLKVHRSAFSPCAKTSVAAIGVPRHSTWVTGTITQRRSPSKDNAYWLLPCDR